MSTSTSSQPNRNGLWAVAIIFQVFLYGVLILAWFLTAWNAAGADSTPTPGTCPRCPIPPGMSATPSGNIVVGFDTSANGTMYLEADSDCIASSGNWPS